MGNPIATRSLKGEVISKVTRRLLPLLFLLYVVAYVDRINIGFAALQIKSFLTISDAGYGFAAGVFFAGYVLFQLPSNLVLERVGARRWIAVLMMVWGLISSCMIFVRAPWHLYVLRFLLGSAEAGFFPGIIFYLKGWFPSTTRARTIALFSAAGALSAQTTSLSLYAARLGGEAGRLSSDAKREADGAEAVSTAAQDRRSQLEGVSLDEELMRMTTYQNAYAASARVVQAATEMLDILMNVGLR